MQNEMITLYNSTNRQAHCGRQTAATLSFARWIIILVSIQYSISFTTTIHFQKQLQFHRSCSNDSSVPSNNYHRERYGIDRRRCIILQSSKVNASGSSSVSLKLVSGPLLDAGKAFARTGELLIDLTNSIDLYGGALSSVGANIRNAGDNIAQAAASCRFKTGMELVIDEIREASSALLEGTDKLEQAFMEANVDRNSKLASSIEAMIPHLKGCSVQLEAAGASLLQRQSLSIFGQHLISVGQNMLSLSQQIQTLHDGGDNANKFAMEASQRCQYASSQMVLAGMNLNPTETNRNAPTTGKGWLKGGK